MGLLDLNRPSPLPPIPFFKFPPRKKSEWRGAARLEGGTRGTPRVAGFRVATRSERTMQFQATTHAERAKSVPLEKGSRKGYDYTADRNFQFRKGGRTPRCGRGVRQFLSPHSGELARRGESEMRGFVSCFKSKSNMNIKPKYFLYARKSTEDDDRQVMSIEAQLFELRELARKENLEILEEFQESKSAKTPGREIFGEMMRRVEQNDGVGILAWHPDRLARNSIDGGRIIYSVDTRKVVSLRFPTFWFEPTPQGLFMLQVAFGQSKYYSDNLSDNIKRGVRQKLRRGEWLNRAPFGYVNNPRTRNIEPHPTLSRIIVRAYEEYAKGSHSFISLAQFLADLGVVSSSGTPLAK